MRGVLVIGGNWIAFAANSIVSRSSIAPHALLVAPHPNPLPAPIVRFLANLQAWRGNCLRQREIRRSAIQIPSPRPKLSIKSKASRGGEKARFGGIAACAFERRAAMLPAGRVRVRGKPRRATTVGFAHGCL